MSGEMMNHNMVALIVAKPGRVRDGLYTLLKMMPEVRSISQADDEASALSMIIEQHPALVLLDTDLPDNKAQRILTWLKTEWSQTQCLVLAANSQEQQMAYAAGADGVLLKGYPAAMLFATIERLFYQEKM